jgi:hypothetical protein
MRTTALCLGLLMGAMTLSAARAQNAPQPITEHGKEMLKGPINTFANAPA